MPLKNPDTPVNLFWFRRDLRIADNTGLYHALTSGKPVLALFIFDTDITDELPEDDPRVTYIHYNVRMLNLFLHISGSSICVRKGKPKTILKELVAQLKIGTVYANEDYEPYAKSRDAEIRNLLEEHNIQFKTFTDQVVFAPGKILKADGKPYTVFTPFAKKWMKEYEKSEFETKTVETLLGNFVKRSPDLIPELSELGFKENMKPVPDPVLTPQTLKGYENNKDYPAKNATSALGTHLRFGKVSIRKIAKQAYDCNHTFLRELIWREFFMQILHFFPEVVTKSFKPKYDRIEWRNNETEFEAWKQGRTGYPFVDAGMRQLNATGLMHNRVRMVAASFLTKHLLMDWRKGEAYFAEKLMDYELASNNGNWQWAAGSGCDAAPYFRIFNPTSQTQKFDKELKYIRKWIPEIDDLSYPKPIVEHKFARKRAIDTFKKALSND